MNKTTPPGSPPSLALTGSRIMIRLSYACALLLTLMTAIKDIQETQAAWWLVLGIMLVPLLAFSRSIFTLDVRGLIWLCFVLCLYFVMASVEAMTSAHKILPTLLAVVVTLLFCSVLVYTKARAKAAKALNTHNNTDKQDEQQ